MTTARPAMSAAGMLLIGTFPSAAGLLTGAVACGVGSAFVTPAIFGLVFRTVPEAERGSAAASISLFLDLGLSGGPMLLGALAAATDLPWGFALVGLVPAVGALALTAGRRERIAPV